MSSKLYLLHLQQYSHKSSITMSLQKINLFQDYNYQSGFVLDTQKGVFVASSAMSPEQYTKYYRTQNTCMRPDLNFRQTVWFDKFYLLGQLYLRANKIANLCQLGRLLKSSQDQFMNQNIRKIFNKSLAMHQIAQLSSNGGYVRTDEQRQKIHNYAVKRLSLIPGIKDTKGEEKVKQIVEELRGRYGLSQNKSNHVAQAK